MAYPVLLSPDAVNAISKIPDYLLPDTNRELAKLSEDPEKHSRLAPSPPFAWSGYIFHFRLRETSGELHYMNVFFLYSDDGKSLLVHDITANAPFGGSLA
jgi:hypothetical protein